MNNKARCLKCGARIRNGRCAQCGFDIKKNHVVLLWNYDLSIDTVPEKRIVASDYPPNTEKKKRFSKTKHTEKGNYKIPCERWLWFEGPRNYVKREWEIKNDVLYIRPFNGDINQYEERVPQNVKNIIWRQANKLILEEGITEIASGEFSHLNFNSVLFPSSLKTIGFEGFSTCKNLTDIEIPEGVERINGCAFENCVSLTNVRIPNSMKYIAENAFFNTIYARNTYSTEREIVEAFHSGSSASLAQLVYSNPKKPDNMKQKRKSATYGMFNIPFDLPGYIGGVISEKKEGNPGFLFYPNRNLMYCGGFENNKKNGRGIFFDPFGSIEYAGSWTDDSKDGFGYVREGDNLVLYYFSKGIRINRSIIWQERLPDSFRIADYNSESNTLVPRYVGETKDGKKDGFGVSISEGRIAYVGMWAEDKYSGPGRIWNYNISFDDGFFKNGLRDGVFKTTYYNDDNKKSYEEKYRYYRDGARIKE